MTAPYIRATAAGIDQSSVERALPELTVLRGKLPYTLTPQILGNDPAALAAMARKLGDMSSVVEVNCGCPTPSAAGPFAGSGILREPERLRSMVKLLIDTIGPGACAVKCRVGYDEAAEWPKILDQIQDLALARLTIHGRTRAEGYHGSSRWSLIGAAALQTSFPVWLSGDIKSKEDCTEALLDAPHVSGLLIGRGALANPFIFHHLKGSSEPISVKMRRSAIVAYALIHDIWLKKPDRLISSIAKDKIVLNCGPDSGRWQDAIQILLTFLGAPPCDLDDDELFLLISGVTKKRLRTLTGYMSVKK